jgi:hypothetical protein
VSGGGGGGGEEHDNVFLSLLPISCSPVHRLQSLATIEVVQLSRIGKHGITCSILQLGAACPFWQKLQMILATDMPPKCVAVSCLCGSQAEVEELMGFG